MIKEDLYEKKLFGIAIKFITYMLKWLSLILCVVCAGLTIGLTMIYILSLFKAFDLSNDIVAGVVSSMTSIQKETLLAEMVKDSGVKVFLAGFGYGVAQTITYMTVYMLINNFITLYKSIAKGEVFTKENINLINDSMPISILCAFTKPVILYVTIFSTGFFNETQVSIAGIAFVLVVYFLKTIFINGYNTEVENKKILKEIDTIKIKEAEEMAASIKADNKVEVKKETVKKAVPKKVAQKKVAPKKATTKTTSKRKTTK